MKFWDRRILDWEAGRYDGRLTTLGPAEWIAGLLPRPTRLRQQLALELVSPFVKGLHVIEVGCGTARLAQRFIDAGAQSYLGVDHSRVAIESARRRHAGSPNADRMGFKACPATEMPAGGDLIVSLGMLDWLTDDELETFFSRHGVAHFFHTFSEKYVSIKQSVHRALRATDRMLRPRAVRPRYFTLAELVPHLGKERGERLRVYRNSELRYATVLSSLPVPGAKTLNAVAPTNLESQ